MKENNQEKKRHSISHLMAYAVTQLWPNVKLGIGPSIDNGFYYDFDFQEDTVSDANLKKIEKKMKETIKKDLIFECYDIAIEDAIEKEKQRNQNYKVELLEDLKSQGEKKASYYRLGEFEDLCRGPHVDSLKEINFKSFKLTKVSGAYWRGDEKNKMLTRIYGLAFETEEELKKHLEFLIEAEKRDHRKINNEMDLFGLSDKVGQGLILWHPKLSKTREALETWWREVHRKNGYNYIYTPHIGKSSLWKESGHLGYFKDSMYPSMQEKESGDEYYVKPMSCPFHVEIYKSQKRSYRDFPIRWNELGTCYRNEKSGELHGMARSRGFTQDDAHIFCTKEQFKEEYRKTVELTLEILSCFNFNKFKYCLAVRDLKDKDKYVGDSSVWDVAEETIQEILKEKNIDFEIEEGGAKFYGPALDVKIYDAIGREWQCSTIQLDMNLPLKFQMKYVGCDGKDHTPIMIHRAIFGSLERFCSILIEHYAGAFPVWLSPVQIKIISVSEKYNDYCYKLLSEIMNLDFRAEVDDNDETIGNKVRKAIKEKVPYILVIGDKEIKSNVFSVKDRGSEAVREIKKEEFFKEIKNKITNKN